MGRERGVRWTLRQLQYQGINMFKEISLNRAFCLSAVSLLENEVKRVIPLSSLSGRGM